MIKTSYIVIEGCEGVGKSTQCNLLVNYLRAQGYRVLETKEPGTSHSPLTMELRNIMLNAKYEPDMTQTARELVSQAIRSIHLEKVVVPALGKYDFIVQDRGILSGFAYGEACGNSIEFLMELAEQVTFSSRRSGVSIYDNVILLTGNVKKGLDAAISSKKEFEAGDAIEMKGLSFMEHVNHNMIQYSKWFKTTNVHVDGKTIEDVFADIVGALDIRSNNV